MQQRPQYHPQKSNQEEIVPTTTQHQQQSGTMTRNAENRFLKVMVVFAICFVFVFSSSWLFSIDLVSATSATVTNSATAGVTKQLRHGNKLKQHEDQTSKYKGSSRIGGYSLPNFDVLKERVKNPIIRDDVRGKTWKELGVVSQKENNEGGSVNIAGTDITMSSVHHHQQTHHRQQQSRRKMQEKVTLNYFAVYDEFGPSFQNMGDTAGFRGNIYNVEAQDEGLSEEYLEGALQGTCSVVATSGKQMCSYELFMLDEPTGIMGSIVATGSILMEVNKSNILIIEATGDDFSNFNNGMVILEYTAIGGQTVFNLEVTLDRR